MTDQEKKMAMEKAVEGRIQGASLKDVAVLAGVDRATLYRWRQENAPFATCLHQARVSYKLSLIQSVRQKRPEFLLEKQFPDEFGKGVDGENSINQTILNVSSEGLAERLIRLFAQDKHTGVLPLAQENNSVTNQLK